MMVGEHNITFMPVKGATAPIEVRCSCGVKLPAHNGTDAMNIARIHVEGERVKEIDNAITT